ncbi:MAG: AI-2E family transporter [Christensenellaceae bacterium]
MKVEWNKKYTTISTYVVIVATIVTLIVLFFLNLGYFGNIIAAFFAILIPFIFGFGIAYLLSRPAIYIEKHWLAFVEQKKSRPKLRRGLAILITFIITFGIIALLVRFIIPQLLSSITVLLQNIPLYLDQLETTTLDWLKHLNLYTTDTVVSLNKFQTTFLDITKYIDTFIAQLPQFIGTVGVGIFNFFIGLIVCVYILFSREKFVRQGKKLAFAVLSEKFADKFIDVLKYSNNVFLGFIMGTLVSSTFVGISTFIFMTICQMPYAILIAVIVAVTNVVPFFGPFLGAIPSIILLLIVDPFYALAFLIFILILQQIDGNIILPKLIGINIGMSAFWVLFALLVGGGLFGFWGLLLGVPVFAVIYSLIAAAINSSLEKKGVPKEKYIYPRDVIVENNLGSTYSERKKRRDEMYANREKGSFFTRKKKKKS